MKQKKGQAIVESVLIITLLFGLVALTFNHINEEGWIDQITPSNYIKRMARYGRWTPPPNEEDLNSHPNHPSHFVQSRGGKVNEHP